MKDGERPDPHGSVDTVALACPSSSVDLILGAESLILTANALVR